MDRMFTMNTPEISRRRMLAGCSAASIAALVPSFSMASSAGSVVEQPVVSGPSKTSWASFRQDPAQQGIAGCDFAAAPKLKWEFQSKDGWVATAAVVGNHVYAPALSGNLHCLDLKTGKEIWKYRSIESDDPKEFAPGFKAAPLSHSRSNLCGRRRRISAHNRTSIWKAVVEV